MTCPRCQGLMVWDVCCDLAETQGIWVQATRCMNCGHMSDPTMDKHRQQASTADHLGKVVSVMGFRQAMGEM